MLQISRVLLTMGAVAALALTVTPLGATPPQGHAASLGPAHAVTLGDDDDDDDDDLGPCKRTVFKTEVVKVACAKGGQLEAKKAMKRMVRDAKKRLDVGNVDCNTCHEEVAPEYTLKADGLKTFEDWQRRLAMKPTN